LVDNTTYKGYITAYIHRTEGLFYVWSQYGRLVFGICLFYQDEFGNTVSIDLNITFCTKKEEMLNYEDILKCRIKRYLDNKNSNFS
jgi:hypothetical protein